jgi:hypothetical protein
MLQRSASVGFRRVLGALGMWFRPCRVSWLNLNRGIAGVIACNITVMLHNVTLLEVACAAAFRA